MREDAAFSLRVVKSLKESVPTNCIFKKEERSSTYLTENLSLNRSGGFVFSQKPTHDSVVL